MKAFRDTKRRATQQMLQTLGVVKGVEDSEFQEEAEEYKRTITAIKSIQVAMRNHLVAIQKQQATAAALAIELSNFYHGSPFEQSAKELGEIHERMERVQLAAVERLYEEKIISAADEMLWQVPEIEDQIKQRKGLLLDFNAHLRKYESLKQTLANSQNEPSTVNNGHHHMSMRMMGGGASNGSSATSGLFRRKSDLEVAEDCQNRKLKLDQAELAVNTVTDWLRGKFQDLAEQKEAGEILRGPVSALVACELHLTEETSSRLGEIKHLLPQVDEYSEILTHYDSEFQKISSEAAVAAATAATNNVAQASLAAVNHTTKKTKQAVETSGSESSETYFGQPLASKSTSDGLIPPTVVFDCLEFIEENDGLSCEGIFRIPGSQDVVNGLRSRYNAGETYCLNDAPGGGIENHDAATLLKLFFRELPQPLIPCEYYDELLAAVRSERLASETVEDTMSLSHSVVSTTNAAPENRRDLVDRICDVVSGLPREHVQCLGLLLHFLKRITENAEHNKMNAANLATCFAPTIIRAPEDAPPHVVLHDMQVAITAVKLLIENAERFPNPKRTLDIATYEGEELGPGTQSDTLNLTSLGEGLGL